MSAEVMDRPESRPVLVILDGSVAVTGGLRAARRIAQLLAPWMDTVLVLPRNAEVPADQLTVFAAVERLPLQPLRKSLRSMLLYWPSLIRNGSRLVSLMRRWNSDRLIINDFPLAEGWACSRLGYDGCIWTWVRFDPSRFPRPLVRFWLGAARKVSNRIVAVSDSVARQLPTGLNAVRVYDCIDPDLEPRSTHAERRRDIVCVANFIPGKGQDHAIEAFALIASRLPATRLIFFGGDMELDKNRKFRASLQRRVAELRLSERVFFNGFASDIAAAMSGAAVALNLSESESFSLTCLEAQQLGLPVVAFRSGGPEEIIIEGETGFLIGIRNIRGVATALAGLLEDPAMAHRMGEAAAASVRTRFGTAAFVETLRSLLFEDLSLPGSRAERC